MSSAGLPSPFRFFRVVGACGAVGSVSVQALEELPRFGRTCAVAPAVSCPSRVVDRFRLGSITSSACSFCFAGVIVLEP